ncbi:MAG TPA: FkbM family methyltransferase [Arenibaculum sp.]|nr:FkbM family methyltransferase [Arenibaculum sp.]
MSGMAGRIAAAYGMARSLIIYRANPLKRRRALAFYGGLIGPGDLCFDIGAHVGDRISVFRALGARVVAVEPQPAFARLLRLLHGRDPGVHLVSAAVGPRIGEAELNLSRATPTLSTLAGDWARHVAATPNFRGVRWDERVRVPVTTLDALIERHGLPAFCKIDVEGFEPQVLAGLSQPLPCLSFEFVPAARGDAVACLDRLDRLGRWEFQVSVGESFRFALPGWSSRRDLDAWLQALAEDHDSGDIYARPAGPRSQA